MLCRTAAFALAAAVAAGAHAPFMSWSTHNHRSSQPEVVDERFDRVQLLARVRGWNAAGSNPALHFLLVDELHTEELTTLAASREASVTGALKAISSEIVKGRAAVVVPRAHLHDAVQLESGRLRDQIAAQLEGCSLVEVAGSGAGSAVAGARVISRQAYTALLGAEEAASGCEAFFVPLRRSELPAELAFVASLNRQVAGARPHTFVFTAEAAPAPAHHAVDAAAEAAAVETLTAGAAHARFLQQSSGGAPYVAVGNIQMLPEIVAGLLVGLLLLAITWFGVCCTLQVRTPDIMHSTTLPAGKEY